MPLKLDQEQHLRLAQYLEQVAEQKTDPKEAERLKSLAEVARSLAAASKKMAEQKSEKK